MYLKNVRLKKISNINKKNKIENPNKINKKRNGRYNLPSILSEPFLIPSYELL